VEDVAGAVAPRTRPFAPDRLAEADDRRGTDAMLATEAGCRIS